MGAAQWLQFLEVIAICALLGCTAYLQPWCSAPSARTDSVPRAVKAAEHPSGADCDHGQHTDHVGVDNDCPECLFHRDLLSHAQRPAQDPRAHRHKPAQQMWENAESVMRFSQTP